MDLLSSDVWSPYLVGVGIGILSCISLIVSKRLLGCSTAYAKTIGMLEVFLKGNKAREKSYYRKFNPEIDWESTLLIGIIFGALISSVLSGSFNLEQVPNNWEETLGSNYAVRFLGAFIGGVLLGFGARMAGGCTSGHGISGTIQLALGSWLAVIFFFIGGILTAFLIYGGF